MKSSIHASQRSQPMAATSRLPREVEGARERFWANRWLMALLALALVLGPALGQMHRVVHAAASSTATSAASSAGNAYGSAAVLATDSHVASGYGWIHDLFAGHGPAECQLLDEHNHGYAGPPALQAFTPVVPDTAVPLFVPQATAGQAVLAFFDARGPPLHHGKV
ncbi:MAG: hypothetical protein RR718_13505 [Comamonas sp.]